LCQNKYKIIINWYDGEIELNVRGHNLSILKRKPANK
jgi:hypothetical protein